MKIAEILIKNYDYNFNQINILECGAYDGSETALFRGSSNCFYLEPQKDLYENMLKTTRNVANLALSDKNGLTDFYIARTQGESSIEEPKHARKIVEVETITYKSFLDRLGLGKFHVLVLDIEGHETTVLKDIFSLDKNHWPEILCIECGYDWSERQKILEKAGYIQDFYAGNNCYLRKDKSVKIKKEEVDATNAANSSFKFDNILIYTNDCVEKNKKPEAPKPEAPKEESRTKFSQSKKTVKKFKNSNKKPR